MKLKASAVLSVLAISVISLAPASVLACSYTLNDDFGRTYDFPWHFTNYEDLNGQFNKTPGLECGVDACAKLERSYGDKFLRVSVNSTTTAGIYTNTDVSEVEIGTPTSIESGVWNPTVGHPVELKAKVRWNSTYNIDGTGTAVGTSGVVLWNSAVNEYGPMPEYDQIGFIWTNARSFGGFLAGLTGSAAVNFNPLMPLRPSPSVNIHNWVHLKLLWSVDASNVQSVEYFVNGTSIGTIVLPESLHNLSVEMWNDNQEPTFTETGLSIQYPAPSENQTMDVDQISVRLK